LRRARLAANAEALDGGGFAGAFDVVSTSAEHGVPNNLQVEDALRDNPRRSGREGDDLFVIQNRPLRFDPLDQPWPKNFSSISNGCDHDGHLQGSDVDLPWPKHKLALSPVLQPLFRSARWENCPVLLARGSPGRFAEVQPLADAHDILNTITQAVGDEIKCCWSG